MTTEKEIRFIVHKPDGYMPISNKERKRITQKVMHQLLDVANRFDGSSKVKITIQAKGNA